MGVCAGKPVGSVAQEPGKAAESKSNGGTSGSVKNDVKEQMTRKKKARKQAVGASDEGDVVDNYEKKSFPKPQASTDLIVRSLKMNFLFSQLSSKELVDVADSMYQEAKKKGEIVIEQGSTEADHFYVIEEGNVKYNIDNQDVGDGGAGKHFGELALMYHCPRAATVMASEPLKLWVLDRIAFRHFVVNATTSTAHARLEKLQQIDVLAELSEDSLKKVSEAMLRFKQEDGTEVITEGDTEDGDIMYMIEEGQVEVFKGLSTTDGKRDIGQKVATLGHGKYFGEQALLTTAPRGATVKCKGEVTLLALDRETFQSVKREIAGHMSAETKKRDEEEEKMVEDRAIELKKITLADIEEVCIVGKGAFGMVKLMRHKKSNAAYALKILQKKQLVQTKQCRNIINEKRIMHRIKHPFCITLCATMKDRDCLYLLMEFLQGGDMFTKLCDLDGHFEMRTARHYAACVLSGFAYIHAKSIVYRDLKPENLVFDENGVLNIVDFGMAKIVKQRTYTVCGTPEYMAPEIINGRGHDQGADYWALGILCYEMLFGQTPFADVSNNHLKIYKKINRSAVTFPTWADVGPDAPDVIKCLLKRMVFKRLGCLKEGADGIKAHKWFQAGQGHEKLDFAKLEAGAYPSPLQPTCDSPFDVSNFDDWSDEDTYVDKFTADGSDYIKIWDAEF